MNFRFVRNVIFKALVLFVLINLAFSQVNPLPFLGSLSAYNHLFPGRQRLPFSENPDRAYNLSLFNLEAMFASHELAGSPKPAGEYRVLLIGDSSTWGFLLPTDKTLAAYLNTGNFTLPDGRRVRAYNLGYPVMSLMKDLLLLSIAMHYQPDMIVWPVTLESFPYDKQLYPPLLQHNPEPVRELISKYRLNPNPQDAHLIDPGWLDKTLVGRRRELADLARLQLYGVTWAATGIDQDIPETFTQRMEDLLSDETFHNLQPPHLDPADLALDVLHAGLATAGNTPVLIINEPMFISQGENNNIRYNFFYPRWAYDDFRQLMEAQSQANHWNYRDFWNTVDNTEFTNSAVHLTPRGSAQFAKEVGKAILETVKISIPK